MVFSKTKRVHRHIADSDIASTVPGLRFWILRAIRHENDAGDAAAPVPAVGEDLEAGLQAFSYVGFPASLKLSLDDVLDELILGGPGHGPQFAQPFGFAGKGDDREAIHGAELADDELHGHLQLVKLRPSHASADVEDGHEVQPRALPSGGRVDDLQQHLMRVLLQWRLVIAVRDQTHSVADMLCSPCACNYFIR